MLLHAFYYLNYGFLKRSRTVVILFDNLCNWRIHHLRLLLQLQGRPNPNLMDDNDCNYSGLSSAEFSFTNVSHK